MPTYVFRCATHGEFEIVRKMAEAGEPAGCPECGLDADRVWLPTPDVWACDGSHKGDYGKGNDGQAGSKRDLLNKRWSKAWGEKPPAPAKDVPKNSRDKA